MFNLLITLLVSCAVAWIGIRLLTWLVSWLLWHLLRIHLKVGSVGPLTLSNVQLRLGNKLSLELEKIWLSSSYVNPEIKKPVCICLGDIRVQVVVPEASPPQAVRTADRGSHANAGLTDSRLKKFLSLLQFVSLQLESVHIIILKDSQDSMINLEVKEIRLDWSLQQTSLNLSASANQFTSKVLKKQAQNSEVQPCLAELSLCISIAMLLDITRFIPPEVVKLKISNVQAMVTEGIVLQIQKMRKHAMETATGGNMLEVEKECDDMENEQLPKIFSLLPKEATVEIEQVSAMLCRETAKRSLSATVRHTSLQLVQGPNFMSNCSCEVVLEDFQAKSPQANISRVSKCMAKAKIQDNSVTLDTRVISSFLGYHHEEIHYWQTVFSRLRAERGQRPSVQPPASSKSNSAFVRILKQKTYSFSFHVQESSMAVAMVSCAGLKGGLSEGKVSVTVMPEHREDANLQDSGPDVRVELEVTALYCKLADGGAPSLDLGTKQHHWNTLCYLGIVIFKASKMGEEVHIENMTDCVQLEWSTAIGSVIGQLVSTMRKTRSLSTQFSEDNPFSVYQSMSFDQYLNEHRKTERLKKLATDAIVNVKITGVNLFATNDLKACVMLRLDSCSINQKEAKMNVLLSGAKVVYFLRYAATHVIHRSVDLLHCNGHLRAAVIEADINKQCVELHISEDLSARWSTAFHMTLVVAAQDVAQLVSKVRVDSAKAETKVPPQSSQLILSWVVSSSISVILQLSKGHKLSFGCPGLTGRLKKGQLSLKTDELVVTFDQHDIFTLQGIQLHSQHHSELMRMTRKAFGSLSLSTNRCFTLDLETLHILFPYQYDFAACVEEVINLNKWRKLVHKKEKQPFTAESPLPPDLCFHIKNVRIQVSDDPMEVKLWDNYELMVDEFHESDKRKLAMDKRIAELRKQYGLLPDGKVQELYTQLTKKSAEVYVQRIRQLVTEHQVRTRLFTWHIEGLDIVALADTSFHGKENVLKHMKEIDCDSPIPEESLEFTTLFCRYVSVDLQSLMVQLRDFPQPMWDVTKMHVWGRFIGAEQEAADRAKRSCTVEVAQPWGDTEVYRSMPPLKFYHDFSSDIASWSMAYGSCWEPIIAEFNLAMNLINKPSLDPSLPLPFWDKFRLLLHGRLTMSVDKMSWLYHVSFDPYNTTELMDWTWTDLVLDWTNAKWVLKGNLDIFCKTASKYDDCKLLHLPNLRFCVRLDWVCLGDPNDHHSVMPCAPDKVPDYSVQEHDSFRSFRSQCLNLNVSLETKPSEDVPSCVFYSSTLKWLDKFKNCMARVSRPIRRGKLFNNQVPRKPILSRHYRDVHLSVNLHQFEVCYWVSFARQNGMEMRGNAFQMSIGPQLDLVPVEDGLVHRKEARWTIQHFKLELHNATIWLCNSNMPSISKQAEPSDDIVDMEHEQEELPVLKPVTNSFFLNIQKLSYQRHEPGDSDFTEAADLKDNDNEQEKPLHKMQIYNLKGSFTASNRNVALSLYDGYNKAASLRKNLSAEALKGFKVDKTQTPNSKLQRSHSLSAELASSHAPSPMSRIQSGHAFAMLKKLVSESDSKFVAVHEEVSGGDVQVEQLHGVAACQTDDVVKKNWHIEVYDSQVMLKGCETPGYVIVSAAKTSILSCEHQPVWKDRTLKTKDTWVGSIECMQYYGTINAPENLEASQDNIMWVSQENIQDRSELPIAGMTEMVGTGQSVGGIISSTVGATAQVAADKAIQLQRIISRCKCQIFYANYGEADVNQVAQLPPRPSEESDMMRRKEGVDAFTLLHHDLNISTNSKQFAVILDIVNNLVLYVEPKKKDLDERLQGMRFMQQLSSGQDHKTPILEKQNEIRQLILKMRKVEKELYLVLKDMEDKDMEETNQEWLQEQRWDLEQKVHNYKEQLNAQSDELNIMISCYKENQLQSKAQIKASKAQQAQMVKINEVCFKHAEWRLTDVDGQLGIADLVLRNFLYSKVNKDDDSGSHLLELGWAKANNLLPNTNYRDVLNPQGLSNSEKQTLLRILCKFRAPVGGIAVKEHLEINVSPVTIQLTRHFYKALMAFFFPDNKDKEQDNPGGGGDTDSMSGSRLDLSSGASIKRKGSSRQKQAVAMVPGDIDKMKDRAAKNNTFIYVKVPEVPMKFTYKGLKEKNIEDLHDVSLILPMLEYHNKTWTWLDLLMAMKNDSKKDVIAQAIKQKLHVKSRTPLELMMSDGKHHDHDQEEDKAKMLLGAKLLTGIEKATSKKSLFGKSSKKDMTKM